MNYWIFVGLTKMQTDSIKVDWKPIVEWVEKETGVPYFLMQTSSRKREFVEARQIAMSLLFKYFKHKMSLSEIGRKFNRDHATVIHSIKCVNNLIELDKEFRERYKPLITKLI